MADVKSVLGKLVGGSPSHSSVLNKYGLAKKTPSSITKDVAGVNKKKEKEDYDDVHDTGKNAMDYNTFYSVVTRSKIKIPTANITTKKIKGKNFAIGTYQANGKTYKAYKVLPKNS
jgi:hypothetical protein